MTNFQHYTFRATSAVVTAAALACKPFIRKKTDTKCRIKTWKGIKEIARFTWSYTLEK